MSTIEMMLEAIALFEENKLPAYRLTQHLFTLYSDLPDETRESIRERFYELWGLIEEVVALGKEAEYDQKIRTEVLPQLRATLHNAGE